MHSKHVSIIAAAIALIACSASTNDGDDSVESHGGDNAAEEAITRAAVPMNKIERPAGVPASWDQPPSEGSFGQYGYCGATAAANLLRWYDREVSPRQAIDDGCWSSVGTRPATLAAYFRKHHPELGCELTQVPGGADALSLLKYDLMLGRPTILLFMTGGLNAHWVTAIGVDAKGPNPNVLVESWGKYYAIPWAKLEPAWRAAYGGPYPHLTCEAKSPHASALRWGATPKP